MCIKTSITLTMLREQKTITGLSGPFWFIQPWLNSILKKHLIRDTRFSFSLTLESARLIYYTSRKKPSKESFRKFIKILLNSNKFIEDLAHFAQSTIVGPFYLKKSFPMDTHGEQAELIEMWSCFLTWDIIVNGLNIKDVAFFLTNLSCFLTNLA